MSVLVLTKKMVCKFVMVAIFTAVLILPVHAAEQEDIITRQEEAVDIAQLERTAKDLGGTAQYGETLDRGLSDLIDSVSKALGGVIRSALKSGVALLAVILFCGIGEVFCETVGKIRKSVISLAGTLAVAAISVADVNSMLGLGRSTIEGITSFSNVLLPVIAAVTAATGAVTGAAVRQMAAVLFSNLLVNLIYKLLIPLLYGYLAASISFSALGNEGIKKIGGLLKWAVVTLLTTVMIAFIGYLSLSGVVSGSADAMAIKATKFAISSTIPVVGGILSDAAESILASAGVLKGSVGVFGAVTILGLCLVPLLRIAVHYLMYKLVGALSSVVGSGRVSALVDQIGSAFGMMMGMTGACCLLLLISLVSSITAVSI